MKKRPIYITAGAVVALLLTVFVWQLNQKNDRKNPGDLMSVGDREDANARANYELRMLADSTGIIPYNIREKELAYASTLPNDAQISNLKLTSTWQPRGPWNVGGRTRAVAYDIYNPSILLAGTPSGGMWRSTDGGSTWSQTTAPNQLQNITCIAQDKRALSSNVWYYGSGEATGTSASGGSAYFIGNGIYKSTDNGLTWTGLASTNSNTPHSIESFFDLVWNVATNPADITNDVVYAATFGSIQKSMDGGTTWTVIKGGSFSSFSYHTDVQVSSQGVVYATLDSMGPDKGIWRSPDGITFTNIIPPGFPPSYERIVIGISPSDEDQVYFFAHTPRYGISDTNSQKQVEWNSLWKYTYVSGDGTGAGGIWQDLSANLPVFNHTFNGLSVQGSYDMVVRVKPDDTNTVFLGGTNLYRSTNGFTSTDSTTYIGGYAWGTTLPAIQLYPVHHPDQHDIVFHPSDPQKMISANDGGLFFTDNNLADTIKWSSMNNGYLTTMFYAVAMDHATSGNKVLIGGAQDNGSWYGKSSVTADPWAYTRGGDGSYCAVADNRTDYYFSSQASRITKTNLDANGNVLSFARIDPIGGKGYIFINPFVLDPNNTNRMYLAGGKRLWRNDDLSAIPLANTWDSISTNWVSWPDSDTLGTGLTAITALAVSKTPANRVYYGTDRKRVFRVDNANTGTTAPVDISPVSGLLFPAFGYVSSIAVDPDNADNVLVIFSNYNVYSMYYTANGGTTWAKAAGNLEQTASGSGNGPSIRWASILPVSDGKVYLVGTSVGLFATDTLKGASTVWVQQATNTIGNTVCTMIDTRLSDGLVAVATHGKGIFTANITSKADIVSAADIEKMQNGIILSVYPNPSVNFINLDFKLTEKAVVELILWDELGRKIKTITEGALPPGDHHYQIDRNGLPAGLYYYSLSTPKQRKAGKLIFNH